MRDPRLSASLNHKTSDLLGTLDALRTQGGTLLHQEILPNTPAGSQYLRFWGRRRELSAGDWRARELKIAPELPTPASVPRPWRRPEPVAVPKACSEAPDSSAHVSCLLKTEVPRVGPWARRRDRAGRWHRTPAAPPPPGEMQTALLPATLTVPLPESGALGPSQGHLGERETAAPRGAPHDPAFQGPSSA